MIGATESGTAKIAGLLPNGAPVTVTPATATVTPTTLTLAGVQITEPPVTGVTAPAITTTTPATQIGRIIEAQMPPGSAFPLGIDRDPAGGAGAFFYAVGIGGPTSNRIGRVKLPVPVGKAKVTGGGFIEITVGTESGTMNFGFVVNRKVDDPTAPPEGQLQVVNKVTGDRLHSVQILTLTVSDTPTGKSAEFSGTCRINGTMPCTFEVQVEDNGEPGRGTDKFGITVVPQGDNSAPKTTLSGGNIQIHKD